MATREIGPFEDRAAAQPAVDDRETNTNRSGDAAPLAAAEAAGDGATAPDPPNGQALASREPGPARRGGGSSSRGRSAGLRGLLRGAVAGLVATAAMTVAMESMFRRLPPAQRFPLPPRFLVVKVAARTGASSKMDRRARDRATMLAHFAFGASAGSLFPMVATRVPLPPPLIGMLYGVVVYLSSYAGWVPVLRLYPPPHDDAPHRTMLMLAAHLVWGSTLGIVEAQARRVREAT